MSEKPIDKSKCKLTKAEMVILYNSGLSTMEISKLALVSDRYIRMVLKEEGTIMRATGNWKRKYTVNENFFKEWTNEMAYILGFFCADGCIIRNQESISFAQKEQYILEHIRDALDSNHPIIINKKTLVYILNIHSKIIKGDLVDLHGIKPNKSMNLVFPLVPEKYTAHFIRGYFDGDGYVNYNSYFVSFVGGSYSFMTTLRKELERAGFETNFTAHTNHYRVYLSGRKTIKQFPDWIYKDKNIFLKRKYEEFHKEELHVDDLKNKIKTHKNALEKRRVEGLINE